MSAKYLWKLWRDINKHILKEHVIEIQWEREWEINNLSEELTDYEILEIYPI